MNRLASRSARIILKQIALGLQTFADTRKVFSPSRFQSHPDDPPGMGCGGKQPSWIVRILRFIEEGPAYAQWRLKDDFESYPDELSNLALELFLCPSRRGPANAVIPNHYKDDSTAVRLSWRNTDVLRGHC